MAWPAVVTITGIKESAAPGAAPSDQCDPSCGLGVDRHAVRAVRVDDRTEPDGNGGTSEPHQAVVGSIPPCLLEQGHAFFVEHTDEQGTFNQTGPEISEVAFFAEHALPGEL